MVMAAAGKLKRGLPAASLSSSTGLELGTLAHYGWSLGFNTALSELSWLLLVKRL